MEAHQELQAGQLSLAASRARQQARNPWACVLPEAGCTRHVPHGSAPHTDRLPRQCWRGERCRCDVPVTQGARDTQDQRGWRVEV